MAKIPIHDGLALFREAASSNHDLGDRFERFSRVWMWNEFPRKGNIGDVGVDVVAEESATGELCAIQCKFYLPEHTLSKGDLDSYFTALGNPLFTSGMIVSTTDKWGGNAEHAAAHQTKQVSRLRVQDLDDSPVDWSKFDLKRPTDLGLRVRKNLRRHQDEAIKEVLASLHGCIPG